MKNFILQQKKAKEFLLQSGSAPTLADLSANEMMYTFLESFVDSPGRSPTVSL